MIDVHPAPHAAHSWREFFIHIATIAIGLLLALGLEQTVEAAHHNHQRHQFEESLHDQSVLNARKKVNSLLYLHASPSQLTPEERSALLRAYSEEDQELGNLNYILLGYDFLNEAALAGRIPTIDELAAESRRAEKTEGQHPPVNAP